MIVRRIKLSGGKGVTNCIDFQLKSAKFKFFSLINIQ